MSSLQFLINKMSFLLDGHKLCINTNKTVAMVFNKRLSRINKNIRIFYRETVLSIVDSFKYLGCFLTPNLCEDLEIDRGNLSFKRSFGFLFRKFNYLSIDVFYSLFGSFCSSFYGSELWVNRKNCSRNFKSMSVVYHSALKKILGLPKFYSNHFTCGLLNAMTFENFINFKCIKFIFWLFRNDGLCFTRNKFYFMKYSRFKKRLDDLCNAKYNIVNPLWTEFFFSSFFGT